MFPPLNKLKLTYSTSCTTMVGIHYVHSHSVSFLYSTSVFRVIIWDSRSMRERSANYRSVASLFVAFLYNKPSASSASNSQGLSLIVEKHQGSLS